MNALTRTRKSSGKNDLCPALNTSGENGRSLPRRPGNNTIEQALPPRPRHRSKTHVTSWQEILLLSSPSIGALLVLLAPSRSGNNTASNRHFEAKSDSTRKKSENSTSGGLEENSEGKGGGGASEHTTESPPPQKKWKGFFVLQFVLPSGGCLLTV